MMWKWFAPPRREDEYETFAARVLHYTLLLLMAVALLFVFFASSPMQLIFIPIVLIVFGGCYYLLHRGHFQLPGLIFLSGFWLVITFAAFSINGIRNSSLSAYAIVIIFSAVLFSKRAVVAFTLTSMLVSIVLAVGETAGVLPLQTTPLFLADRFFQLMALFGAAGVLLTAASGVIRASYARIRKHEQTLLERNRELEQQIAERQQTEASLRISEAKYRLLFENIPVMAAVYGHDGEIILMNKATAQLLGGTPETLRGRNMRDVVGREDAEFGISVQARVAAEGVADISEGKIVLPNGHELYYLRHIMPLPNITGLPENAQVLVLTTDLTERHKAEQRERELALAQEKNAFLTDFFSTLSHDLKTPLAIMNTSMYLLERAQTDAQREQKIQQLGELVALMDRYIQDMLIISRLEHLPTLNFETVALNPLVEETMNLLRPSIERKHLACQFKQQADLPPIRGDQEQLRRLLTNLIENAVNYTPSGGEVTVRTHANENGTAFEVTDTGIGIDPEAVPHIFERFFRAPNARASESSGTGLGLAIVKKIVDTHAASINVHSQIDEGTTISIQFPRAALS
jgi:PAS domain S-box-containing protein